MFDITASAVWLFCLLKILKINKNGVKTYQKNYFLNFKLYLYILFTFFGDMLKLMY